MDDIKLTWKIDSVEMLVPIFVNFTAEYIEQDIEPQAVELVKFSAYINMIKGIVYLKDSLPEWIDEEEFKQAIKTQIKQQLKTPVDIPLPENAYQVLREMRDKKIPTHAFSPVPPPPKEENDSPQD